MKKLVWTLAIPFALGCSMPAYAADTMIKQCRTLIMYQKPNGERYAVPQGGPRMGQKVPVTDIQCTAFGDDRWTIAVKAVPLVKGKVVLTCTKTYFVVAKGTLYVNPINDEGGKSYVAGRYDPKKPLVCKD